MNKQLHKQNVVLYLPVRTFKLISCITVVYSVSDKLRIGHSQTKIYLRDVTTFKCLPSCVNSLSSLLSWMTVMLLIFLTETSLSCLTLWSSKSSFITSVFSTFFKCVRISYEQKQTTFSDDVMISETYSKHSWHSLTY